MVAAREPEEDLAADSPIGVVQSVAAQHSVRDLRKQLQEEFTGARPPVVGAPIQSRKRARNDDDNTNIDTTRLTLPPPEVSQATRNPGVMEIVEYCLQLRWVQQLLLVT